MFEAVFRNRLSHGCFATVVCVQTLSRRGYGDLSSSETLCVLRWLSDVLMDSRSVRAKIAEHVERQRQSRVTAGDRKKAEEQDRLMVESLAHRGESEIKV